MWRSRSWLVLLLGPLCACRPSLPPVATPDAPLTGAPAPEVAPTESDAPPSSPLLTAKAQLEGPVDERIDIGGRSLHVQCEGSGSPLVVFDAGFGDDARKWSKVLPDVAKLTRACAYDRLGLGQSSPAPENHSLRQMTDELHLLLEKLAPGVPRVLVAHSLSALIARLYTSRHPAEVVGLVLVDPATEDQDTRAWPLLSPEHLAQLRSALDHGKDNLGFEGLRAGMAYLRRAERDLGNRPLVVLTSAKPLPTVELHPRLSTTWVAMQKDLAALSTSSRHTVTDRSGHYIQVEEPELVILAVREVLEKR